MTLECIDGHRGSLLALVAVAFLAHVLGAGAQTSNTTTPAPTTTTTPKPDGGCCRPPWNRTEFQGCGMPGEVGWPELTYAAERGEVAFRTAGLGSSAVSPRFEVWMCAWDHPCDVDDSSFCFAYDEIDQDFVPWGLNSELKLFHLPAPPADCMTWTFDGFSQNYTCTGCNYGKFTVPYTSLLRLTRVLSM
jgi:hypothetical protein